MDALEAHLVEMMREYPRAAAAVKAYVEEQATTCMMKNCNPALDMPETQMLRGRIKAHQDLLSAMEGQLTGVNADAEDDPPDFSGGY